MKILSVLLLLAFLVACEKNNDLSGVYVNTEQKLRFTYDLQSSGQATAHFFIDFAKPYNKTLDGTWSVADGIITVQVRPRGGGEFKKDSIGRFSIEPNGDLLTIKSPEFKRSGIRFVKQGPP